MLEKKWFYTKREENHVITLADDKLSLTVYQRLQELSLRAFFAYPAVRTTFALDAEICRYLVQHFPIPKNWDTTTLNAWQFWKAIDLEKLSSIQLDTTTREMFPATFHFTVDGSYEKRLIGGGHLVETNFQRLDRVFFEGPLSVRLPLDTRRALKETCWNALHKKGLPFRYKDGFPLFNYQTIPSKKWEVSSGQQGDYIQLTSDGHVEIGGWDSATQGGSKPIAVESFWANPDAYLERGLERYKNEIVALLGQHILS